MALLKRSVIDNHLFLRGAGTGRPGTWQIGLDGEKWLQQQGYDLPSSGEGRYLSQRTISLLEMYLHTLGYEKSSKQDTGDNDGAPKEGLPLLLDLGKHTETATLWELTLDFAELIRRPSLIYERKGRVSVGDLSSEAKKSISSYQLQEPSCWPRIAPQWQPYCLFWQDGKQLYTLPATSGLQDGEQGTIFVKRKGTLAQQWWRRCLSPMSVTTTDCEQFYWLAKAGISPDWPGAIATEVGKPIQNWQLWQLGIGDGKSVFWGEIEEWFVDHGIDFEYPTWRLQVLNPFSTITTANQYLLPPAQPLLIQCNPPQESSNVPGQVQLIAQYPGSQPYQAQRPFAGPILVKSPLYSYFRLPPHPLREYDVRLSGETGRAVFKVTVAQLPITQPAWLYGLRCTITGTRNSRVVQAFHRNLHDTNSIELHIPEDFTLEEMPDLNWSLEPVGLPLSWKWEGEQSPHQERKWEGEQSPHQESFAHLQTGDLSSHWQEIWPSIKDCQRTRIFLDAGNFGRIELLVMRTPPQSPAKTEEEQNTLFSTQLIWLSNLSATEQTGQTRRPLPASLRTWLSQTGQSVETSPALSTALLRLAHMDTIPVWILWRLQALRTEHQVHDQANS